MSRYALVSIHSEHVSNILAGNKVFEYRKVIPSKDVSHLVLYCTAPVKKIVAVVEVVGCLVGAPSRIWTQTAYGSGISRQFFRDYFSGRRSASAFVLGNVYALTMPMELRELTGQKTPPQSFYYLDHADIELINKRQSHISAVPSSMLFVGGIHGVGKSTMCQKAFEPLGYQCETASSLITAHGRISDKEKRVSDVSCNQVALLEQLQSAREQYCRLLLDGHFTLINGQGQIEPIDPTVFEAMKPGRLILIKGDTEEISSRLAARDNKKWDHSFLTKFQNAEEEHARYVSEKIQVPLQIFENTIGCARLARTVHGRRI
ncbi:MAG: AAA family ATPase [Mariprofundus sp.]